VVRCESCSTLYTNPRPTRAAIGSYYPAGYAPYDDSGGMFFNRSESVLGRVKDAAKRLFLARELGYPLPVDFHRSPEIVNRRLAATLGRTYYRIPRWQSGAALDVGCGGGGYLRLLSELGWSVRGFDIADNTTSLTRSLGVKVHVGNFERSGLPDHHFSLVTMWHVLEHFHDPIQALREAHRILKDDGELILEVPNAGGLAARVFGPDWLAWDLPRHLTHFTIRSLYRALNIAGFTVTKQHVVSGASVGGSVGYLEGTYPIAAALPIARSLKRLPVPWSDAVAVWARKRSSGS